MRGVLLCTSIVLLVACVDQETVVGDERSRLACDTAASIVAPPSGCTTISIASVDPYGCAGIDPATGAFREHAGSWVRLGGDGPATLHVALTGCPRDGGVCTAMVTQRYFGLTPCTCDADAPSAPFTSPYTISFDGPPVGEILLEPLGATFDVSLCAGATGPSP